MKSSWGDGRHSTPVTIFRPFKQAFQVICKEVMLLLAFLSDDLPRIVGKRLFVTALVTLE